MQRKQWAQVSTAEYQCPSESIRVSLVPIVRLTIYERHVFQAQFPVQFFPNVARETLDQRFVTQLELTPLV